MTDRTPLYIDTSGATPELHEFATGDVLPVSQGGTGSTTDSEALTALGGLAKPSTGLTEQTSLVDSDQFALQETGGTVKKTLWSTIKNAVRTWMLGQANTWTADQTLGTGYDLVVNGYTKLGESSPNIKCKKITGTTASAEGGDSTVAHGLTFSKIISASCLIDSGGSGHKIAPGYYYGAWERRYSFAIDTTNCFVILHEDLSSDLLSQPFTILIWYEE